MPLKRKSDSQHEVPCQESVRHGTKRHKDLYGVNRGILTTESAVAEDGSLEREHAMRQVLNELSNMEKNLQEQARQQRFIVQSSSFGIDAVTTAKASSQTCTSKPGDQVAPGSAPATEEIVTDDKIGN